MRRVLKIASREYKASVRTKGFIVGLVVAPLLMGGSLLAIVLLEDRVDTTDKRLAVIDRSSIVAEALVEAAEQRNAAEVFDDSGKKVKPAYIVEVVAPDGRDPAAQHLELSDRVRRGELYAFLDVGPDVLHPRPDIDTDGIRFHAENAALDDMRRWLSRPVNNQLRRARLEETGLDVESVSDLFSGSSVEGLGLVSVDKKTGVVKEAERSDEGKALGIPMAMMMLLFMMIMMGAMPLLNSVTEEKLARIAEVLLGSVRPSEFMAGKILGGLGVSLTASAVYVIGGALYLHFMDLKQYIPYDILPWFFVYMITAIVMLGAMLAAVGASVSDPKDAQSLMFPAMLPIMIPMFVWFPVVKEPLSGFSTGMSLIPPFTPMLMLVRQSSPMTIPAWQPWVGLASILATAALAVWAGGRIFRVGILMQGKPPKPADLIRWAIRG
jgi:ABC-2 type transport system permease protein